MSLTLAAILAESATRYPDRDAVVIGPQRITYAHAVGADPPVCERAAGGRRRPG